MDVYEAIASRRSVRSYEDLPIEPEVLQRILQAGARAPSARNRQAWKFVVVQSPEMKRKLARQACQQPWMERAGAILAVVGTDAEYVMHCGVPADPVDCAIAIDHMTLAATAEGLGTCWIGHFDQQITADLLDVPDSCRIIELLTIGQPADQGGPTDRKPLEQVVCRERFEQ